MENIGGTNGDGQAYHGYWTLDPTQLNGNFGTADDLTALVKAVHDAGMNIMVDVVVNHVAAVAGATFQTSDSYGPFNTMSDFHPYCVIDYANETSVEQCWLGDENLGLPDLNTESQTVIDFWNGWIKNLTATYDFDAVRIDTVKHIRQDFWPAFVSSAGVYAVGEVLDGNTTYVAEFQNNSMSGVFNYPVYYQLVQAFNSSSSGSMSTLAQWMQMNQQQFKDTTLLGNFLNNHDNPRFESYTSDAALIRNANAFPFLIEGIPFTYYGTEQGFDGTNDPYNREPLWTTSYNSGSSMYAFFRKLNQIRTAAANASSTYHTQQASVVSSEGNEIVIWKSPVLSVLSNRGSGASTSSMTTPTSFGANVDLIEAFSCNTTKTDGQGNLQVNVVNGMPSAFLPISDKGNLCSSSSDATSSKASSAAAASSKRSSASAVAVAALAFAAALSC